MNRILSSAALLCPAAAVGQVPGTGFEVDRYAVSLRPGLTTAAVTGTEAIVLRATVDGLAQVAFSPNRLRVSDATVDGTSVRVSSDQQALTFALPRPLRTGAKVTLRLAFAGTPARGLKTVTSGIYAAYFACDWMICLQDSPGDKAHFALDLFLPTGSLSLGIGRRLPTSALPGGMTLHRWRSTRPWSPYLFAFAAGSFAQRSDRTPDGELVYLADPGRGADLARLAAQTPAIVTFFRSRAGLPLPDRRYAQLLVSGSEAQEAAGFSLVGEAELDDERGDPQSAWVVAHELAHQWWGNLVTCASWQDFWLNEGIATFMVAAWKQHSLGKPAYRQELGLARRRVERVRALGYDKPLAWAGPYPTLGARRAVQYSKGALFLAHLRDEIGDAAFWRGLRAFTRRHAGGTVTSRDLETAMQQAAGRDLSPLFREWVYGEPERSGLAAPTQVRQ